MSGKGRVLFESVQPSFKNACERKNILALFVIFLPKSLSFLKCVVVWCVFDFDFKKFAKQQQQQQKKETALVFQKEDFSSSRRR